MASHKSIDAQGSQFVMCRIHLSVVLMLAAFPAPAAAKPEGSPPQDLSGAQEPSGAPDPADTGIVSYTADFFARYRPITARDMVERVPGFRIDDGGGSRGFGGAAGNVLINGERPSTKDDSAAEILDRIPASLVTRIDLIRGQAGGLDLRGQSLAVNVILRDDGAATVKWEAAVEQDIDSGAPTPEGSASLTDRWGATRYTVGLEIGQFFFGSDGIEKVLLGEAATVAEDRFEIDRTEGHEITGNLNTETEIGQTVIRFNGKVGYQNEDRRETSRRAPRIAGATPRSVIEGEDDDEFTLEVGGDVEKPLGEAFSGKAIALFKYVDSSGSSSERILDAQGRSLLFSRAPVDTTESESIARLEFDWTGLSRHRIEANLEGAFNSLENALMLFEDRGEGPVEIPLPGANTRVEEVRGDFDISDSVTLGAFTLDTGLAAETSTISQTGDVQLKRNFFFIKPRLMLTYAPDSERQVRLRFAREVAQLDFDDFVSATNFGDDQFDLGNPDLAPENTWIAELAYERRFGEIGVITLTGFHHWINDVQDLLPVGGIFEVPGNIGDGRRYGMEAESTLPLDILGVANGRLDIEVRWQDSTVEDPVTGLDRALSNEREFDLGIDFRQDFEEARFAWGWKIDFESDEPAFGIDERVLEDDVAGGPDMDMFIETTRWRGVKMRLLFENVANRRLHRDRSVFDGARDLTPLAFREVRDRRRGRSLSITLSGSF